MIFTVFMWRTATGFAVPDVAATQKEARRTVTLDDIDGVPGNLVLCRHGVSPKGPTPRFTQWVRPLPALSFFGFCVALVRVLAMEVERTWWNAEEFFEAAVLEALAVCLDTMRT